MYHHAVKFLCDFYKLTFQYNILTTLFFINFIVTVSTKVIEFFLILNKVKLSEKYKGFALNLKYFLSIGKN